MPRVSIPTSVRLESLLPGTRVILGHSAGNRPAFRVRQCHHWRTGISPGQSYRQSIVNPLSDGEPSYATKVVIQRYTPESKLGRWQRNSVREYRRDMIWFIMSSINE